jgi:hypothetical protein
MRQKRTRNRRPERKAELRQSAISSEFADLRSWSFITNHAQVLLALARDRSATVADLAGAAQITERSAYRILADLQQAGYVRRRRVGRQNSYEIRPELPLGDPTVENELVRDLLRLLGDDDTEAHLHVVR